MTTPSLQYIPENNINVVEKSKTRSGWLVQVETTSRCNGKCVFCPYQGSWSSRHPGEMSDALYEKTIRNIADLGGMLDRFCPYLTNEPFLDSKILDRIRLGWKLLKPECVEIATNASVLTPALAERLAETLQNIKHEIWISFHGINREMYESIMGLPFDKTLANVINLLKLAESRNLKIVLRGNGFSRYATKEHPYYFERTDYRNFWERVARDNNIESQFDVKFIPYHDRAGNLRHKQDYDYHVHRNSLKGAYCWRVDKALHITWDGLVVICCNDVNREVVYGNIANQPLKDILLGTACTKAKKMAFGAIDSPTQFICKRCAWPGG